MPIFEIQHRDALREMMRKPPVMAGLDARVLYRMTPELNMPYGQIDTGLYVLLRRETLDRL